MRLICGILRLDGNAATAPILDAMASAMTAPNLTPAVIHQLDGPLGMAVLDFAGGGRDDPAARPGWLVAADLRLDRPMPNGPEAAVAAVLGHGPDFPNHLHGDFAVALWNAQAKTLWLGRDFIGVRPLAWTWQPERWFAFASLPKGLHGSGLASTAIDPVAIGCQAIGGYFTESDSGFAEIAYLPGGRSLCVRPDAASKPETHRAYRPDTARVGSWKGTAEEAARQLRDLVEAAVTARMPPDGTVACHLTGGLDSSSITVLAAREARRRGGHVLALSMTAPSAAGPAELDERPLIAAVLAQEADVRHLRVDDTLPLPGLPDDADWPGSIVDGPDDRMMQAAAAFGAQSVLSGVGGDEGASYNGANLYLRLLREGKLRHLARELPARARGEGVSLARAIRGWLVQPLVPDTLRRLLRRRPRLMDERFGVIRFVHPAIRGQILARRMPPVLNTNTPAQRVTAFAAHHIPSRCTYYSIMAARHGLAASFPLLDRSIVDFVLSLPASMFLADGQSRQPFRRAMRGILPDRVRLATQKVGLFDDRFLRYAERKHVLLEALAELRADPSSSASPIFDLDALGAALQQLPDPGDAHAFIRTEPGPLAGGRPVWLTMIAIRCLTVAHRLAGPSGPD